MILVPEQARTARLGLLLLLVGGGFLILAPDGFLFLPLAALGIMAGRSLPATVTAVGAGVASLVWLIQVGDPVNQLIRAGGVASTVAFVGLTLGTRWSLIHRALSAVTIALAAVLAMAAILGVSWGEIFWWVSQRAGLVQAYLFQFLGGPWQPGVEGESVRRMEALIDRLPTLMANVYPAATAVQIMAGFGLATMVARRLTLDVPEAPPQAFMDFRFSEHLGWPAVGAMGVMLVVEHPWWRVLALNVLVVTGLLYALRGAAVGWFALRRRGRPGCLISGLIAFSFLFLWQVMLPAIIMLGIVDTGLDIRRRLVTPK